MSVGVGMFKDSLFMGTFPLPPPPPTTEVDYYEAHMSLTMVKIVDLTIPSISVDTIPQLHPQMECDQPTMPTWVVDSPSSYDFLDFELPSEEVILENMASIDNPKEYEKHREFNLPDLEPTIVITMSLDP
jgi:hypothetical protein